jgi:hypothetical protein
MYIEHGQECLCCGTPKIKKSEEKILFAFFKFEVQPVDALLFFFLGPEFQGVKDAHQDQQHSPPDTGVQVLHYHRMGRSIEIAVNTGSENHDPVYVEQQTDYEPDGKWMLFRHNRSPTRK